MKLHNTLTRSIDPLKPLDGKTVRIYTCGPTVYDHIHIGNLRSYIFADTLHRALEIAGLPVQRAMNYTDVDDKTIRRSLETYKDLEPRQALHQLTTTYIEIFLADMRKIGNRLDNLTFLAATDNIEAMKALITKLHAAGFAYIADDGVYFSIAAYRQSGKKYGQLLELTTANTSEARIQNDEYDKASAHDFALWKTHKASEPSWPFSLDGHKLDGRPGWHIECSAMADKALGQPFDIHTGGVDNIFPHHENEIAQSTAGEANPVMAQCFIHGEHLLVDGKKMAKSAHNFYTLEDVVRKGHEPLAFRLKVLQSHYRSQLNFTWEGLEAAQNLLSALRAWADLKHQKAAHQTGQHATTYKKGLQDILGAMENDLGTPEAIAQLANLAGASEATGVEPEKLQALLNIADKLFGLNLADRADISHDQKALLADREAARAGKDWAQSDNLRDQLKNAGLGVRDTPAGPLWYRLAS